MKKDIPRRKMFGPDGKPRCTVCRHPRANEIDARLMNGETPGRIIKIFDGLKKGAVVRHRANHLNTTLPKRLDPVEMSVCSSNQALEVGDVVNQVRSLYRSARQAMDDAEAKKNHTLSIKANAQALRCLEVYFKSAQASYKIAKEAHTKGDMMTLSNAVLGALSDHPEARLKVIEALQKLEVDK